MEFDIENWIKKKRTDTVLLEHVGDFTSSYIDSVLPTMEKALDSQIEADNIRKKVFHIFVECIQNLYHHIEPLGVAKSLGGSERVGAILLVKDGDGCRVTTGNFVTKSKEVMLQKRIEQLNSLSVDEVKRLYRETINNSSFSEKGGAGIGMIDMARKTGNKLHYQFYPVQGDPDTVFYSFDVYIN